MDREVDGVHGVDDLSDRRQYIDRKTVKLNDITHTSMLTEDREVDGECDGVHGVDGLFQTN